MRFITLENGDIWTPQPDNPPKAPPGYFQDKNRPYLYHLIIKDCQYRFIIKEKLCCKRSKDIIYCDHYEEEISQIKCKECLV